MMRAARMAARFELTVEPATAAAVRKMAAGVTVVSADASRTSSTRCWWTVTGRGGCGCSWTWGWRRR